MGLKRFLKKVAKKSIKANVYLLGGGAVKDTIKVGVSGVSKLAAKNPELASAALTAGSAGTGLPLSAIFGALGGNFGGEAPPYEPPPVAAPPDPDMVPGFDNKTLLLAGAALAGVALIASR